MVEKLIRSYDTEEEVPDAYRGLYEHSEKDGKFVFVGAQGFVETERLDKFRQSNINLQAQIEELQKRYEGIDPSEIKSLKTKVAEWDEKRQEIEDQKLLDEKNIEEIRRQATKKIAEERDKGFTDRDTRIAQLETRLNTLLIHDEFRRIGIKKKLNDWSVEDLVMIGSQAAGLTEEGNAVVYDTRNGQRSIRYNDQGDPMTLEQWADELIATRSNGWLPPSSGGGPHHQQTTPNGRVPSNPKPISQWTTAEKVAFGTKHGWDAFEKKVIEAQGVS